MKKNFPHALFIFLVVAGLSAFAKNNPGEENPAVTLGSKVQDFSFADAAGTVHKLSEYTGKIVVFEWTNPGCPFVQRVYSEAVMQDAQKKYTTRDVVWIAVNSTNRENKDFKDGAAAMKQYEEWNASFSFLCLDPNGEIGKMFNAKTTPHVFILDKTQTLVYAGALDDDPRGTKTEKQNYVANALDELLAGKPVTTSTTTPYGCSVKYK
jgi:thioredoxin-related protein